MPPVYRSVTLREFQEAPFTRLSPRRPSGQALYDAIRTGPLSVIIPGLAIGGRGAWLDSLPGWKPRDLDRCLAELEAVGAVVDLVESRVVFLPWVMPYAPPDSSKSVIGWRRRFDEIPESKAKRRIGECISRFLREHRPEWVTVWGHAPSDGASDAPSDARNQDSGIRTQDSEDRDQEFPSRPEGAPPVAKINEQKGIVSMVNRPMVDDSDLDAVHEAVVSTLAGRQGRDRSEVAAELAATNRDAEAGEEAAMRKWLAWQVAVMAARDEGIENWRRRMAASA
jgi:hypothetical protein